MAVDIRKGSPTFGQHVDSGINRRNHRQYLYQEDLLMALPYLVMRSLFQYKCDNFYAPQSEGGIAWNDPDLNIDWRIPKDKIILSEKIKCTLL